MKVLIAIRDAVYARMLELEFSERRISCEMVFHAGQTDAVFEDVRLAVIDAGLLLDGMIAPPPSCEAIVIGYPEELARIPTQELTRYYAVVRPFVVEDFLDAVFVENGAGREELRPQRRKPPSQFLALDEALRSAYYKGEKIELTAREFALLRLLLENKGKPVSRAEALERVFEDSENDTNVVDVYINYLRTKIDTRFRIRLISTVRGCGYMISD